jgi:site-specific DNA-cytosine methylase
MFVPTLMRQREGKPGGGKGPLLSEGLSLSLAANANDQTLFQPFNIVGGAQEGPNHAYPSNVTGTLQHKGNAATGNEAGTVLANTLGVRRLTPTECERLQGFPDGWTEGHADSHRYRMLGNAVAVPCAKWIGTRLAAAGPGGGK